MGAGKHCTADDIFQAMPFRYKGMKVTFLLWSFVAKCLFCFIRSLDKENGDSFSSTIAPHILEMSMVESVVFMVLLMTREAKYMRKVLKYVRELGSSSCPSQSYAFEEKFNWKAFFGVAVRHSFLWALSAIICGALCILSSSIGFTAVASLLINFIISGAVDSDTKHLNTSFVVKKALNKLNKHL